jgi:alpha-mannosidase
MKNLSLEQLDVVREWIGNKICTLIKQVKITAYKSKEPLPWKMRYKGQEKRLRVGDKWGDLFDCAWFHFEGTVPEAVRAKKLVLVVDISGEACIFDGDGRPMCALTNVNSIFDRTLGKPGKTMYHLPDKIRTIDVWADAGCNDLFGTLQDNGIIKQAHIAVFSAEIQELYFDFEVLLGLLGSLDPQSSQYIRIGLALSKAAEVLKDVCDENLLVAREFLKKELSRNCGNEKFSISAIGHAHIDLAWLWPVRETRRKAARTFSNVLMLMDKYPEFVFGASQPQLYEWVKQDYPDLYRRIKQKVRQGRWELQGCMWVEADTNISGGESLVRQIYYGKKFFKEEFGVVVKNLWLPDCFGYTGALPQMLKKSGINYFVTQKLSWNDTNDFPHHTFWWEGIDGSRVFVHLPPEDTYNSPATSAAVYKIMTEFQERDVADNCLMIFGIGDGGGGPGTEHLERLRRQRNCAGLVPVIQEPAQNCIERLAGVKHDYAVWKGELYLEKHRGTYTTQAKNKRYNRRIEFALRELEFAWVLSHWTAKARCDQTIVDEIWKEVLLYQFHDILPGSSITRVYNESIERYRQLLATVQKISSNLLEKIEEHISTIGFVKPAIVYNSLSWNRDEQLKIENKWYSVSVGPLGYNVIDLARPVEGQFDLTASDRLLENDLLRIRFDKDGYITSIFDKPEHRELLRSRGNVLSVYQDTGDAWDFEKEYRTRLLGTMRLVGSRVYLDGPTAVLVQERKFEKSKLIQHIVLKAGSRRLDFQTSLDWKDARTMLRTAFPLNIRSMQAVCDIQFGNICRPTHSNTSWDEAKYEVCAHKWVDISEPGYGAAMLNDCKYGYCVQDNVLDLNLLRTPIYPDQTADIATHELTYSFYPHPGDHIAANVNKVAYELNVPLNIRSLAKQKGRLDGKLNFVEIELDNIIIESLKPTWDGKGYVIRLYESNGRLSNVKIKFGPKLKIAYQTDLMEQERVPLKIVKGNSVELLFGPFEINTVIIECASVS